MQINNETLQNDSKKVLDKYVSPRYKGIIFILILIVIILAAVIVNFSTVKNKTKTPEITVVPTQKPSNPLCKRFAFEKTTTTCDEAVEKVSRDTPGIIRNIQVDFLNSPIVKIVNKATNKTSGKMWIIDIELQKPFTTAKQRIIRFLRLGIPINGDPTIYRIPIEAQ